MSLEFIGAFESTYLPAYDVDVMELSSHSWRWRDDLALLRACGVERLRYPCACTAWKPCAAGSTGGRPTG